MSTVLFIGAHPDDEALGCGGTLRAHAVEGDRLHAVYLTSGESGGHGIDDAGAVREREAHEAARIIGIGELEFWHERDGALRARAELVERLARLIRSLRPARIYVPHAHDDHADHRAAARIVTRAAVRSGRRPELRGCEIWTPIEQIDDVVDVSAHLEVKLAAIRAYASQCAVMRFGEAFEGLARYRGEMFSWPGGAHAEVFVDGWR